MNLDFLKLPDRVYNALKWLVIIVLPASATLYSTLAGIWGLPYADAIPASITAITTFLGAALLISTARYNKSLKGAEKKEEK